MTNGSDADQNSLMPEESVALTLAAVVLSVMAILSNGLLIYVVVRTSALHTSINFFIASLSAGELLTGLFVIPFAGASTPTGDWAFSPGLCCLVGFMGVLGPCVSALSLLVVSADRYVAISKPLRYAVLVTNMSTVIIVMLVWTSSLLVSLLPLLGWGSYSYSDSFKTCLMRSTADDAAGNVPEVVVKEIFSTFIPVVLVVLIVFKTVQDIRGHRRVFAFVPVPVAVTSLPAATSSNVTARKSRVKATRTLLLVCAAYVTICVPSAVASIMCQRPSSCYVTGWVLRTMIWISFLSCVINPLIIMTLNSKFRARLKALFCRGGWCRRLLQPGAGDKEPFTISSGLQAVLEASLLVNVVHGTGRQDANLRRHAIMMLQARAVEQPQPVYVQRVGLVTLRKTRSSPDCRLAVAEGGS